MSRQIVGAVLVGLIFLGALIAFVPFDPRFPDATLDSGWAFALNVAVAKGMVFGRDIIFTCGPYAAAYTRQYHPATDAQTLWSTAFIGVALAAGIVCLSRGASRISMVGLTAFLVLVARDTLFLFVPFTFLLLLCRLMLPLEHPARLSVSRSVQGTIALQIMTLSLLALTKGTFAVSAVGAMVIALALLLWQARTTAAVAVALLFLCSVMAFWTAAGQPPGALLRFVTTGSSIVSGYTAAMSTGGTTGHALLFVVCSALLGLTYARFFVRGGVTGGALFFGTAFILFVSFKAEFVRQAEHAPIAVGVLALIAWLLTATAPRALAFFCSLVAFAGWFIVTHDLTSMGPAALANQVEALYGSARHALVVRMTTPDELPWSFADSLSAIRNEQSLPRLIGSVDIYSYAQSALLARDPQWAPRPVVQSYDAYTPELEALNAAHLAGPDAPANVLFSVQPIDRHLPALEDGLSWPALLTRYDLVAMHDDLAVLRRRPVETVAQPTINPPIASGSFRLGDPVTVPTNAPLVWARITVSRTALGKVVEFLDKLPNLTIRYQFADGTEQPFRFIPAMGEAGFVAAPLIETTTDLMALEAPAAGTYFAGRRPTTFTISADSGAGWLWASSYKVDLFRLQIAARPLSRILFDHVSPAPKRARALRTMTDCAVEVIDRPWDGRHPITVKRFLRLVGWVATPGDSVAPADVVFSLRPPKGRSKIIVARSIPRGDVGGYLDLPPVNEATYTATADLATLTGRYAVTLDFRTSGRRLACATNVAIQVVGTGSLMLEPELARSHER